jgi:spermidine/putrescine transport system permease protein
MATVTATPGSAAEPRVVRTTKRPSGPVRWVRERIIPILGSLVLFYMFLPIFVVILFSFNLPNGRFNYQWVQFSTQAWTNLCAPGGMCEALRLSLFIGLLATLGAVAAPRTCSSSCRWPPPRSSWVRRCSRCSWR